MNRGDDQMCKTINIGALALLGLAMSPLAMAQSTVTVYGVIDVGLEHVSDLPPGAGANGGSMLGVNQGNLAASRLGFKGSEDLGGGLKAVFNLESGLAPDTGTVLQNGRLFGRKAYVGLSGNWGNLLLGRQQSTIYDIAPRFDPLAYALYGLQSQGGIFGARADNAVKYEWIRPTVSAAAMYSVGRDALAGTPPGSQSEVAGASRIGRELGTYVTYSPGALEIGLAFDQQYGTSAATQSRKDENLMVALSYRLRDTKLFAGFQRRNNDTLEKAQYANLTWFGLRTPISGPLALSMAVFHNDLRNSPDQSLSLAASLTYGFSKRTTAYLNSAHVRNSGKSTQGVSPAFRALPGHQQNGVVAGIAHVF
jgi:predicted porin